jgi:hypothetical protein
MADLDAVATNYRRVLQRWPSAPTLTNCYEALSACFSGSTHGLVEHVKSFIESVCLTIMGELREPMPSSTPSTTDLLVAALGALGLRNTKGTSKLDKVLSGFNRLSDALAEMRNETGPVAHGKDGFLDSVTADHARAFLHAGDAILGVLLNAFEGKQPDLGVTREPYESFLHLNERIDRAVSVVARVDEDGERPVLVFSAATEPRGEAFELRVEPSRLLYGIDREAYIEVLKTAELVVAEAEDETEGLGEEVEVPEPAEVTVTEAAAGPVAILVSEYTRGLDPVRSALEAFLVAEGLKTDGARRDAHQLVDSLLSTAEHNMALDWKEREPIQARIKVACKRVLVAFGLEVGKADDVAGRLIAWLRVQADDSFPGGTNV